jgi:hypothetical protein
MQKVPTSSRAFSSTPSISVAAGAETNRAETPGPGKLDALEPAQPPSRALGPVAAGVQHSSTDFVRAQAANPFSAWSLLTRRPEAPTGKTGDDWPISGKVEALEGLPQASSFTTAQPASLYSAAFARPASGAVQRLPGGSQPGSGRVSLAQVRAAAESPAELERLAGTRSKHAKIQLLHMVLGESSISLEQKREVLWRLLDPAKAGGGSAPTLDEVLKTAPHYAYGKGINDLLMDIKLVERIGKEASPETQLLVVRRYLSKEKGKADSIRAGRNIVSFEDPLKPLLDRMSAGTLHKLVSEASNFSDRRRFIGAFLTKSPLALKKLGSSGTIEQKQQAAELLIQATWVSGKPVSTESKDKALAHLFGSMPCADKNALLARMAVAGRLDELLDAMAGGQGFGKLLEGLSPENVARVRESLEWMKNKASKQQARRYDEGSRQVIHFASHRTASEPDFEIRYSRERKKLKRL